METTLLGTDHPTLSRHEFFTLVGTGFGAMILTRCMGACASASGDDPTPTPSQKVDFTLRLEDKANENLLAKGGYLIVNDVIVAQTKAGDYLAVSARCTHQNTQLTFRSADNQFYCPLHQSRFDTKGNVISPPATLPLTQYTVERDLNAGTLRIHN